MAAQRHLDDLNKSQTDPNYRWQFNADKVNKVCQFIESLPLKDDAPFVLQNFQVWLVASLMGWMDDARTRKYIEALILIPKGNGKSPLAAALGLWFAFFDGVAKAEVFCGAMSLKQAQEVFNPARDFVDSQPAFARLGIVAQKTSIYSTRTGGFFQPVIGKGRHGARPYLAILDELHQAISPDLYDTFKTGCNKTPNSLILTISTAGVASANNPCYALQLEAEKMLQGIVANDRVFAAIYCADDSVEWQSEEALRMANPNLGISNDAEKIRIAQAEAVHNPAKQNNTRAMHLDQWSTAAAAWMNMEALKKCVDSSLTIDQFGDDPGWLAFDTSSKLDLSAMVLLFRRVIDEKNHYYAFAKSYLPESQVNLPENSHYKKWVIQGHLTATHGSAIDFAQIEADALDWLGRFKVKEICFDAAHGGFGLVQRLTEATGVVQSETPQRITVVSPAMKELEAAVADGRFHYDADPVLTWCFSNIKTSETANGLYRMPEKEKPENKIDTAMSTFFALSRAAVAPVVEDSAPYFAFA